LKKLPNFSELRTAEKNNQELGTKSYFCKPYHAWEKGTDFDKISDEEIQYIEKLD